MSSQPQEPSPDTDHDGAAENEDEPSAEGTTASHALTITLPEGSENVSDAIVTNREMLREPQDHGLATEQDITHLSEAIEGLSGKVEGVSNEYDETQDTVAELQSVVERQQRQIEELQSMVTSLTDILGTEAEWQTFDDE